MTSNTDVKKTASTKNQKSAGSKKAAENSAIKITDISGIPEELRNLPLKIIKAKASENTPDNPPYIGTRTAVKDQISGKIRYQVTTYGRIIVKNGNPAFISSDEYRLILKNSVPKGQLNTPKNPKETKESTDTGSADIISQLQEFIDKQNRQFSKMEKALTKRINVLQDQVTELSSQIKTLSDNTGNFIQRTDRQLNITSGVARENEWAHIFNNTIFGSTWLKDPSFSPGRWAVGYQFLYVMYRVLNEVRPESILELGLGQSTKMISQYVAKHQKVKHWVVEHDQNWIDFFSRNYPIPDRTSIVKLPWDFKPFKEAESVRCYKDFANVFKNRKFDFISVDGPLGGDMKMYARIDVLSIIPEALNSDFVIMIDDTERPGEINMIEELEKKLQEAGIQYAKGTYQGEKKLTVICSMSLRFVKSM